ncbi:MAG: N-glycosylase/DNA lyase [Candidatus Aenigmarchaeota archaeon]|nr:N-glycosylase/DNA lyase [Candidatus Aenigmarchaeota archaeon]MDW8160294.1 N-glycosylase/DNA lyase [Candidatus Aenigmarchaeota archaeon]
MFESPNALKVVKKIYEENAEKIREKIEEFKENKNLKKEEKFIELCFCILVAGNSLKKTLQVWRKIGDGFLFLSEEELARKLKFLGYRFYNKRAEYIEKNREKIDLLEEIDCSENLRKILVENFMGIGYKEASHFLRNVGCENFAIIDRHVLKFLKEFKLIKEIPKTLSEKKYLEIEEILKNLGRELKISLAELDICIFYHQTKEIPVK